jgi:hypothetical protein
VHPLLSQVYDASRDHPDRWFPGKVFISFDHDARSIAETMKALLEHELKLTREVFMVTDPNQLRGCCS